MISIIVPIYNTEKYLRKCLESIENQSYQDLEVLLIDDGSTDKSGRICLEFEKKDPRFKYYRLVNGGQGRARNYGLDQSKGDWIAFVDSDDWIKKDMYENLVNEATYNNADLAICGWIRCHGKFEKVQPMLKANQCFNNKEILKLYLETPYITSSMCNKLYRRKLWDTIRFPTYRAREDASIIYKLMSLSHKAVYIGKAEYVQFVRVNSTERGGFSKDKLNSIYISKELRRFIYEKYPDLIDSASLLVAKSAVNLMKEIIKSRNKTENQEVYKELYQILEKELKNNFSENVTNSIAYSRLVSVRDHQSIFKLKANCEKAKDKLIDMISVITLK